MTGARVGRTSVQMPPLFKGKLSYSMLSAEVTRAGLDARREDGAHVIVMWKEIVGVAARRLPSEIADITFVDIISSVGQTLRLLPWTRLTGDELEGGSFGDGAVRSRALLARVVELAPEAQLDPPTRQFLQSDAPAAQLADAAMLAAHDARLA